MRFLRPLRSGYSGDREHVKQMHPYPIFLKVQGRRCVVVGGGRVAERKVKTLVASGARIRLISPTVTPVLAHMAAKKKITLSKRRYHKGDLKGSTMAFAATSDRQTQIAVVREARRMGTLVNVADDPRDSDFLVPARFFHGGVQVALSTGGASPALAKLLRRELERILGKGLSAHLLSVSKLRPKLKTSLPEQAKRSQTLRSVVGRVFSKKSVKRAKRQKA